MEGVSFVLRKNCDHMTKAGLTPATIIATGGGSKSAIWCQMQADITGLPVQIPAEKEAACLGAAMIAAVNAGQYASFESCVSACVRFSTIYSPCNADAYTQKYRRFNALYDVALAIQ